MTFRKIIGFGDSSFVISLPKSWVQSHNLVKGDTLSVEEDGGLLRIIPHNLKQTAAQKEITITFDGNLRNLKSRLVHAYINNYSTININGKNFDEKSKELRELIGSFIALEALQYSNEKIIIKDFLNISDVSVYDLIRRMDRINLSMMEDTKKILKGEVSEQNYLNNRDDDVNKICNLILKVLKRAQNASDMKLLGLQFNDIFYYWDLALNIEIIADQLKRIARRTDYHPDKNMLSIYDEVVESYKTAMKCNFSQNKETAVELIVKSKNLFERCDEIIKNLKKDNINEAYNYFLTLSNIKLIHVHTSNITKTLLKLGMN